MVTILTSYSEEELGTLIEKATALALEKYTSTLNNDLPRLDSPFYPDWLSVKQCAEFRGVSKSLVYKDVYNNTIPHYKRGGRIFFKKSELVDYMNSRMIKSARYPSEKEMAENADRLSSEL